MLLIVIFYLLLLNPHYGFSACNSQCVKPDAPNLPEYESMQQDLQQKFIELQQKLNDKAKSSTEEPVIKIFISTSMPPIMLQQLAQEAQSKFAKQVVFVFRGIKNNDFRGFISEVAYLADSGFIIDPDSFVKYQIEQVPTFVVGTEQKYDRLVGATSISYVLQHIMDNEGDAKEFAEQWLNK